MPFAELVTAGAQRALKPLADPDRAEGAFKYMKGVAPFLGVDTPSRRAALNPVFKSLPTPTSDDLGKAALALLRLKEREYHYAAYDMLAYFNDHCDKDFLATYGEELITTKSWWDTVDGLGNAITSPLSKRFPNKRLIQRWNRSDNIWLVRSAIQHQRGWRRDTDIDYVLSICADHSFDDEFFISKAIGWALRDIARLDKKAVRHFLNAHPELSKVAVREADRGLNR